MNAPSKDLNSEPGLPTFCFKKVWKLCEMLNVRVTADHRPAQAQEVSAGWGRFFRLCLNFKVLAGGFAMRCAKMSWL